MLRDRIGVRKCKVWIPFLEPLGQLPYRIRTITTYFNSIRIEICCYCSYSISRPLPYLPRPRPSPQFPGRLQVYGYTSWYFAILYPLYTGGLFHCYMLEEPICHYRGVRSFFVAFILYLMENPVRLIRRLICDCTVCFLALIRVSS